MKLLIKLLLVVGTLSWAHSAQAEQCQELLAGQHTNVGAVCVTNDTDTVTVTYTTTGDWTMQELHLFVGTEFAQIPANKKGNPQIGHFPYVSGSSGQSFSFTINLVELNASCDSNLVIAAHAVVDNGITNETAWANGDRMVAKGNWATWFNYQAACPEDDDDDVLACVNTETGFALGQTTLNSLNLGNGNANRWGWQLTVVNNESGSSPIYAAAGQNDINNGDLVGELQYYYSNGTLMTSFVAYPGFAWNATHLFADDTMVTTTAPGQFGNTQEFSEPAFNAHYTVSIDPADAQTIFVVAHAEVCYVE